MDGPIIDQLIYAYSHWVTGPRRNIDGLNNIKKTMPHLHDLQGERIDELEATALALSLIAEKDFSNLLIDLYTNYDIIPKKRTDSTQNDCENPG